jgi:hypothetical protein
MPLRDRAEKIRMAAWTRDYMRKNPELFWNPDGTRKPAPWVPTELVRRPQEEIDREDGSEDFQLMMTMENIDLSLDDVYEELVEVQQCMDYQGHSDIAAELGTALVLLEEALRKAYAVAEAEYEKGAGS